MQPTYLPWAGYFNLVASVDVFVLLDDVQFDRRSWQSRNRVLLNGKEHMLTVPTEKADRSELLQNIRIDGSRDWRRSHFGTLVQAYGKWPEGDVALEVISEAFASEHELLSQLNQDVIARIMQCLNLDTPLVRASELNCGGKRAHHLAEICGAVDCSSYLSPQGSREYLHADNFSERYGIDLAFQSFVPTPYPQPGTDAFVSHLSIIDVLASQGQAFAHSYVSSREVSHAG